MRVMAKPRVSLYLVLALILVSLTGGPGADCATSPAGSGCDTVREGASSQGGFSGIAMVPGAPEPVVMADKGERPAPAAPAGATAMAPRLDAADLAFLPAPAPTAAATPLFLRHCSFLC